MDVNESNTQATSTPKILMVEIDRLRPNSFNPNTMTSEQLAECVAELSHLGYMPYPILVRPAEDTSQGNNYEIIDGEHRVEAAKALGWSHVPVVVALIDDFEARRQCYKRNRHGQDDKVKLGRMFRAMRRARKISRRALAKEINVNESGIRLAEAYVDAAELRSACAPETADEDIAELHYRQVKEYLDLPLELRDRWLEAGADCDRISVLAKLFSMNGLQQYGLTPYLRGGDDFYESLFALLLIAKWLDARDPSEGLLGYAQVVADLQFPARVLDLLPCVRESDDSLTVPIPVEAWRKILRDAQAVSRPGELDDSEVQAGVREALIELGVDLASVLGTSLAEELQIMADAPSFIREAKHLSREEQLWLAQVDADVERQDLVLRAKEDVIARAKLLNSTLDLDGMYGRGLAKLTQEDTGVADSNAMDDAAIFAEVMTRFSTSPLSTAQVGERAALELLGERLDAIDWPEFRLLTASIYGVFHGEAAKRWLRDMTELEANAETQEPPAAE